MTTTTRYASAAALGCLYTALAVWLVGAEGRSYRSSLRHQRDRVHRATTAPAPEPAATPSPSDLAIVEPDSRDALPPTVPPTKAAPTPSPAPAPSPAPTEAKPDDLATNVAAKPADPTAAPERLRPPSPPAARSPGAVWADSLDLARLSPEEEARLGGELHRLVLTSNLVDRDGDIQRLRRAATPLLAHVTRKEVEYKFTMLDSEEVNAFSLPGGYIYVSRGLFRLVGEATDPEQDYALQFALGHEIAHVDLKHALTLVASGNAAAKAQGIDTLNQLMVPIGVGYTDAQEFAADAWAYQQMTTRLDQSRREALMFLVKLQGFSERNGFRNGRDVPDLMSGRTLVENHYRAHPAAWDRLERLKSRASRPAKAESGAEKAKAAAAVASPPR